MDANDWDAIDNLFHRHYLRITRFFKARIRNQEDVQDLVQETFLRASKHLSEVRHFERWSYTVARNVLRDFWRRDLRHPPPLSLHDLEMEDYQQLPDIPILVRESIQEVLKQMPRQRQECLALTIRGLKPHEIAQKLRLKESTVRTYVSEGRKKLLNAISHYERD